MFKLTLYPIAYYKEHLKLLKYTITTTSQPLLSLFFFHSKGLQQIYARIQFIDSYLLFVYVNELPLNIKANNDSILLTTLQLNNKINEF